MMYELRMATVAMLVFVAAVAPAPPSGPYIEPTNTNPQALRVSHTSSPSAYRGPTIYIPQMIYPFDPSVISDTYGFRVKPCNSCSSLHQGVDFNPGYGAYIPAVMKGTVTVAQYSGSLGVHVYIDDGYGLVTIYGHMIAGSVPVQVGDRVEQGDIIGQVGNTGTSTGPHLHFAIQINGMLVDPIPVLNKHPNR